MGITLKGLTWDHPRGYAPLLAGIPEYEGQNPEIKLQWDRRTLREFGEAPIEQYLDGYDLLIVDHPFVGFAAAHGALVDLAPFITIAKQNLVSRGFTLVNSLPPIHPTLALFSSRDLVKAQSAYRLINDLKIILPILALLLIGLGIYIARGHRRALVGAGLGFAASMLVLALGLAFFRTVYLNSVPPSVLPSDAAAVIFDTFVRFIKAALRTLLVVGLVVALGAFLSGPSTTAVQIRSAFGSGLGWIRSSGERAGWSSPSRHSSTPSARYRMCRPRSLKSASARR